MRIALFALSLSTVSLLNTLFAEEASSLSTASKPESREEGIIPKPNTDVAAFTPPTGWRLADSSALPSSVKVMVVGKGEKEFPPSINLGTEQFAGTLQEYLKVVKSINTAQGAAWKDLGMIKTEAGEASLSQLDTKTQWGDVRMMHVILVRNGVVYIMTAAALKDEFPKHYQDFFNSMKTLRFN